MEAIIVYIAIAALLAAAIFSATRNHKRAMLGTGADGTHITSAALHADAGWQIAVSIRNIIDVPTEVTFVVEATPGGHRYAPTPEAKRTVRLNPSVLHTERLDFMSLPIAQDIDRIEVFTPRFDGSRRLVSRTDFQ